MFKSIVSCVLAGTSAFVAMPGQAEESLLTNNIEQGEANGAFPEGTKVLPTEMTASWVTEGEFATDEETVSTSRREGADQLVVFDGNNGEFWKSRTYSAWGKGQWVTLTVDLGKPYAVSKVDVWAMHEPTRRTGSVEILISQDGEKFDAYGTATSDAVEPAKELISPINVALETPVTAQYVQIRMKRHESAKQQQIGEIAIWGNAAE